MIASRVGSAGFAAARGAGFLVAGFVVDGVLVPGLARGFAVPGVCDAGFAAAGVDVLLCGVVRADSHDGAAADSAAAITTERSGCMAATLPRTSGNAQRRG